jgi:8-oxo-dGTP pyrophosphatase MutT (NUDIX family)
MDMAKKIHAVGVIFENEHQRILVLRRHPQDPEGATWGLVGGKVEPNESKETTAIRETQEEIGHVIDPSQLQFLKTYRWDREDLDITFEVFKLRTLSDAVTLEIDQNENTEHMWVNPSELYKRKDLMIGLYPILEDVYQSNID